MRTVTEHLNWGKKILDEHRIEDANLSTKILLSFVTHFSKVDFVLNPHAPVSSAASEQFQQLIQKRAQDCPIAYLIGEKEFYSLKFHVNEHVLIPRPETEILIEWFGQKYGNQELKVCDAGTGSGTIAVTLKKTFPNLQVTAVDISSEALAVAKQNAKEHGVEIHFIESDLLEKVSQTFDVIVANLPYVAVGDMATLSKAVQHEPKLALESGKDGLDHYRRLLPQTAKGLKKGGGLFLEFGMGQTQSLISLLQSHFFSSIETCPDLAGIDRIIYGIKE